MNDGPCLRETIGSVELYDSHSAESVFDPTGGRWVTYCVLHGSLVNHATLALARQFARDRAVWCIDCAREAAGLAASA